MTTFTAVVQRDPDTNLYVGYVPGFPGAHSQAESLDELRANLREVIALLLEDGSPKLEAEFIGSWRAQPAPKSFWIRALRSISKCAATSARMPACVPTRSVL
jgi:predicted RNase H-like HicB family nuclease